MFRKAKRNYLELNVRVSYDENDDSVRIIGKDKNLPKYRDDVRLKLDGTRCAEQTLRDMLEEAGIITEDHYTPSKLSYDKIADSRWDEFPLGKAGGTKPVVWNPTSSPHLLISGPLGSGKSVIERSIIFHCLLNPDKWRVVAVDPWNELSRYEKYSPTILGVAKNLDEAVEACRFALEQMMERYEKMEELGVNNYQDLPDAPYGMIFLIDEIGGFLAESGSKLVTAMAEDELKREAAMIVTKISKLGPAAGLHLVLASQYPDSSILKGGLKTYMSTKIVMGRVDAVYSSLILDNAEASHNSMTANGRGYIQERCKGKQFQAAYTDHNWYDEWLKKNNIDWYDERIEDTHANR